MPNERTRREDSISGQHGLVEAAIVIAVGLFATSLAQPQLLAGIPFENLLKNELHVDRAANAAFFFWASFAWYFKPLAGIVSDCLPILGSRRRSYLLISSLLAVAGWIGLYFTPHEYHHLLWLAMIINVCMVFASTAIGAFMVEIAQTCSGWGRAAVIRNIVEQVCLLVSGPGAGYLASIAFGWTATVCAGVMFLTVPVTLIFMQEVPKAIGPSPLSSGLGAELARVLKAKYMWCAAGLMLLFYMAPGLSTALFYKQQNDLHIDTQAQGNLQLLAAIAGIAAATAYGYLCRQLNLKLLLIVGLAMATAGDLAYLFYTSAANAQRIETLNGFSYTLAELAIMDLAIRSTPAGSEGFAFSLLMSVRNFALFGTDWFGSALIDRYHWSFNSVVVADAITTLATIPVVLVLPLVLLRRRDAEVASKILWTARSET